MIIYSNREHKEHFTQLIRGFTAMKLTDWEYSFVESIEQKHFEALTEKQKITVSKIYMDRKDTA